MFMFKTHFKNVQIHKMFQLKKLIQFVLKTSDFKNVFQKEKIEKRKRKHKQKGQKIKQHLFLGRIGLGHGDYASSGRDLRSRFKRGLGAPVGRYRVPHTPPTRWLLTGPRPIR
jgi:hypothetical protein